MRYRVVTKASSWNTLLILCASACAFAQPANTQPAFEVASVKPSPPFSQRKSFVTGVSGGPGSADPTRITIENYMLLGLLAMAYAAEPYQISGPSWLEDARETQFDISAKVPDGATKEQVPLMMRNLLTERFHLTAHREKKEVNVYDLVVAKNGPKLKEAAPAPAPSDDAEITRPLKLDRDGFPSVPAGRGYRMAMMNDRATAAFTDGSIEQLADLLSHQIGRPVTDSTGLKGKYDFSLRWSMEGFGKPGDDPGPTIFAAVQEQLGLRLEQKKGFIDMIVIDHIDKVPTEN
jgi:uncharacterized protein (TIGR03435 family)